LREQIERELEALMRQKQDSGAFISSILGQFNIKEPVEELKLNTIVDNIQYVAPIL